MEPHCELCLPCVCQMYEHEHHKSMTSDAIAAMISTMLYYRRFFPYYVYNIVGGLDEEGKAGLTEGALYIVTQSDSFQICSHSLSSLGRAHVVVQLDMLVYSAL